MKPTETSIKLLSRFGHPLFFITPSSPCFRLFPSALASTSVCKEPHCVVSFHSNRPKSSHRLHFGATPLVPVPLLCIPGKPGPPPASVHLSALKGLVTGVEAWLQQHASITRFISLGSHPRKIDRAAVPKTLTLFMNKIFDIPSYPIYDLIKNSKTY